MGIIQFAIRNPVTTAVGVLLIALFGMVSWARLPVQLTPDVSKPEITVSTQWEGASPHEVEREIAEEQEEQLKRCRRLGKNVFGKFVWECKDHPSVPCRDESRHFLASGVQPAEPSEGVSC